MTTRFPMVLIVWHDAHSGEGHWHSLDENDQEPHIVETCGFLVGEVDGGKVNHVTVVQSVSPDLFADHTIYIPLKMVESLTFLQRFTAPFL